MCNINNKFFFGLKVSVFEEQQLMGYINERISKKESSIIYGYGIGTILFMKQVPEVVTIGNSFDVIVSDGRLFYIICNIFGMKLLSDISLPSLVQKLILLSSKKNYNIFLLGATEENNKLAVKNVKSQYAPSINCLGYHGYFEFENREDIYAIISDYAVDIIFIGMSSPQKEIIASELRDRNIVPVIIPCGGMIDVLAGKVKKTPTLLKKVGVASIYRLVQEPKRLYRRYLLIYSSFIFSLLPLLLFLYITGKKNFSFINYNKIEKHL